jgi:hypothetical protein
MDTLSILDALDLALPDTLIFAACRDFLAETEENGQYRIEIGDVIMLVPVDTPFHVVYKALYKDSFGNPRNQLFEQGEG